MRKASYLARFWGVVVLLSAGMGSLRAAEPVRLGVLDDNYPYSFRQDDGTIGGFAYDLLSEVERVMGLKFERETGGTKQTYEAFLGGNIDVMQSLAEFPERDALADFSVPYLTMSGAIFTRRGEKGVHRLEDLRGRRVLVHRGSLGEAVLRRAGLEAETVFADSVEDAMLKVSRGEGDATLVARLSGLALAHQLGLKNLTPVEGDVPGYQVRYCVAVKEGDRAMLAKINEGLAVLVNTGRYDELYRKWFGAYVKIGYSKEQVTGAVAGCLALALGVALWAAWRQRTLTRQIATQAELWRASEERHRAVFEGAGVGLIVLGEADGRWRIEQINPAALALIGKSAPGLPAGLGEWLGGEPELATQIERLAGRADADEVEFERSGDRGFLRLGAGRLGARVLVNLADVTAAVRARRRLHEQEERLRQKQKLEAVGTLAGGVAHDFNNLLTAIMGNTELCLYGLPPGDRRAEGLNMVMKASLRARDLVRQILTFSRKSEPRREWLHLEPLAEETVNLLRTLARGAVEFELELPESLPFLHADPAQVHQVLMNLGTNAVQAMRGKPGRLSIRAAAWETDAEVQAQLPELKPGRYLRVEVQDSGPGIAEGLRERVFEPFFTTKKPGEGTGLGLSVVHGIMQQHGGAVALYSQAGRGTLFQLYFPLAAEEADRGPAEEAAVPGGSGERVLLVDDDEGITAMTERVLEVLGYRVHTHRDAEEAWADYEREPGGFALVMSDLTMPGMSGLELLERVRGANPVQPFVLMSGFFSEAERVEAARLRVSALMPKPLSLVAIRRAAAEALGKMAAA